MAESSSVSSNTVEEEAVTSGTDDEEAFKTLYLPSFYNDYMDFEKYPPNVFKEELSKKNWVTDELLEEIRQCAPSTTDIDSTRDNLRDKVAHERATKRLFPKGQIFASHVQLFQVAKQFGSLWAFQVTRSGCAIKCHFVKPTYQSRSKGLRHTDKSMKRSVSCPF